VHPQRRQVDRGEQFVEAAAAVAAEGRTSAWHRQQSTLYRNQSARAAWLHDHTATWRTLALALWAGNDLDRAGNDLDVEETAAIVAEVLAEPPVGPPSPPAAPEDAATGG
jgi:hypothetical protein